MTYPEVFSRLTYETAFITFFKKDGTIRLMLATRNLSTVSMLCGFKGDILGGRDNRCNINNGNMAVIDLELGDARVFHIDRLIDIQFQGIISTMDQLKEVASKFLAFKAEYMKSMPVKNNGEVECVL